MLSKNSKFGIWPVLVIIPAIVLYILFILSPSIGNILFSFTDYKGINHSFSWIGFQNYKKAFTVNFDELWNSIKITVIFSFSITLVQNILAVALAVLVNKKLLLRNFYRSVIFLPTVLGVVVHGLIWTLMLDPFSGPVSRVLSFFGKDSALLGSPTVALGLIIFVTIWANAGYAMIIYLAGIQSVPEELYESANLDGATPLISFWHITIPMIRPIITINVLISIIGTLRLFDLIFVLTGGGPGDATMTLGVYIFKEILTGSSKGYAASLQMIHFLIVLVVVIISQKHLAKGEIEA